MKLFTINNGLNASEITPGIRLIRRPSPHISAKINGHVIPVRDELAQLPGEWLKRASAPRGEDGSLSLALERSPEDNRALIQFITDMRVLKVSSTSGHPVSCPRRFSTMRKGTRCKLCGQPAETLKEASASPELLHLEGPAAYLHPDKGQATQYAPLIVLPDHEVKESLPESMNVLVVLKPGEGIRVAGNHLLFLSRERIIVWNGTTLSHNTPLDIIPPSD